MNKIFLTFSFIVLSLSIFAKKEVKILVELSPAGSFEIESQKIKGKVTKAGNAFIGKDIRIPVKKLKTGLDLRDQHLWDKLEYKKYPDIVVVNSKGENGKGVALIQVKNISKKQNFVFKVVNNNSVMVQFLLKLSDYSIDGIRYMGVGVKDAVKIKAIVPLK